MEANKKILLVTMVILVALNGYVWTGETNLRVMRGLFSNDTLLNENLNNNEKEYHLFYVDASDANHCRIPLADTLSGWLKESVPDHLEQLIYVSRGDDPMLGRGAESWQDVLRAIAGEINPEPPVAVFDIERILQYQDSASVYENTGAAYLSFVFSEAIHNISGEEIVREVSEQFLENNTRLSLRIYITGDLPGQNLIEFKPKIEYVFFPKMKES